MKPTLLEDVLREGDYAQFREQLAIRIAAEAQRNAARWDRRTILARCAGIAALAATIAAAIILFVASGRRSVHLKSHAWPANASDSARLIFATTKESTPALKTMALPAKAFLKTQSAEIVTIHSHSSGNIAFSTDPSRPLQPISDAELLGLFARHATALTQIGTTKRLLFLDPKDAQAFWAKN